MTEQQARMPTIMIDNTTLLRDLDEAMKDQSKNRHRINLLKEQAENTFAERNGWKIASIFGACKIGTRNLEISLSHIRSNVFDHALYFRKHDGYARNGRRLFRNVAIVGQPYDHIKRSDALAEGASWNLECHTPPAGICASIWFPGWTAFYVFTQPGETVCWLPEQEGPPNPLFAGPHRSSDDYRYGNLAA